MGRLTLNGMYEYDNTIFDGMILPEGYDRDALFMEIMNRSGQLYPYHQQPGVLKSAIRLWFSRNFLNFDRIMEAFSAEYNPIENYDRHENWTRTPDLSDTSTHTGQDSTAHSGNDSLVKTGKDTVANSGQDTTAHTGTDSTVHSYTDYQESIDYSGTKTTEEKVSAFDNASYQPSKQTTETPTDLDQTKTISGSNTDALTHGHTETLTHGLTETTTKGTTDTQNYNSSEATTYGSTVTDRHTGNEQYYNYTHGNIGIRSSQELITQELELRKYDIYNDIAARFEHEFIVQVY